LDPEIIDADFQHPEKAVYGGPVADGGRTRNLIFDRIYGDSSLSDFRILGAELEPILSKMDGSENIALYSSPSSPSSRRNLTIGAFSFDAGLTVVWKRVK
jgi:hypothetical protein